MRRLVFSWIVIIPACGDDTGGSDTAGSMSAEGSGTTGSTTTDSTTVSSTTMSSTTMSSTTIDSTDGTSSGETAGTTGEATSHGESSATTETGGSTDVGESGGGTFDCGPNLQCQVDTEYCEGHFAPFGDSFSCMDLPDGCGNMPTCDCLEGVSACGNCEMLPGGGLMTSCLKP